MRSTKERSTEMTWEEERRKLEGDEMGEGKWFEFKENETESGESDRSKKVVRSSNT